MFKTLHFVIFVITTVVFNTNGLHENGLFFCHGIWILKRLPNLLVGFWATVCNRFALCCQTIVCPVLFVLSVCPVCDVGVLWPNDWTDQDETWHDKLKKVPPDDCDDD